MTEEDRMRARTLSILLIAGLSVAARVAGQSAPRPDLRVLFLRSLDAGAALRVKSRDVSVISGSFGGVRDSALWLAPPGESVPIAGIDSMWTSHGHAGTGAIVGAVVGSVAALVALSGKTCQLGDSGCVYGAILERSAIVLGGTLVGAEIGGGIKTWRLRFP